MTLIAPLFVALILGRFVRCALVAGEGPRMDDQRTLRVPPFPAGQLEIVIGTKRLPVDRGGDIPIPHDASVAVTLRDRHDLARLEDFAPEDVQVLTLGHA